MKNGRLEALFAGGRMWRLGRGSLGIAFGLLFTLTSWTASNFAFGADRLIIKDGTGNTTFKVEDDGKVQTAYRYLAQSAAPGFWLDETGTGAKGALFVLDANLLQVQRRSAAFGGFEASPLYVNVKAPNAAFYIAESGYVGFSKASPSYPIHLGNGAYCSAGGVWTNASSREYKQDIKALSTDLAFQTLDGLEPVSFRYKTDGEETHLGFIAEDVPEMVATKDRKGLSSMDVVAVLTKVLKEQQRMMQAQQKTISALSEKIATLESKIVEK
ncbi:MAG: tail fiber domain-containing protein [Desulfobacteraceae bacterium]|jgi:hypothetical protein|nr:MAG: tail fiber domain-containing protein [Desulfobacteraceae bacterium]